jgi:hypothetical protein
MKIAVSLVLLGLSLALPVFGPPIALTALWPAVCALVLIILTKHAALGLAGGLAAGALLIHHGDPAGALRAVFADYVFPALDGSWHVGAIVFTLILGAFAGLLEKSGGFDTILARLVAKAKDPQRRLLGGVYVIGLLCFFDGLNLCSRQALGLEADGAVLNQLFLAFVLLGGDQCLTVRDQVFHTHAREPGVTQRLRHSALEGDRVGKRWADGQEGQHIAVLQQMGQSLGVEFKVFYLPLGCTGGDRDAL